MKTRKRGPTLKLSDKDYEKIFETLEDGITILNKKGELVYANPAAARAVGFASPEEFIKTPPSEWSKTFSLMDNFQRPITYKELPSRTVLAGGGSATAIFGFKPYDGSNERWAIVDSKGIYKRGKLAFVISIFHEVTNLKKIEKEVRIRERQQAAIAGLGQQSLASFREKELFILAMNNISKTLGMELSCVFKLDENRKYFTVVASKGFQLPIISKIEMGKTGASRAVNTLKPVAVENFDEEEILEKSPILKDNKVVSGIWAVIFGISGPYGILGVFSRRRHKFQKEDIALVETAANIISSRIELFRVASELKSREERYKKLIDLAPDVIYTIDKKGIITGLNRSFKKMTGWDTSKWIGKSYKEIVAEGDIKKAEEKFTEAFKKGSAGPYELTLLTRYGRKIIAEFRSRVIDDGRGKSEKIGIFRDITQRKKEEEYNASLMGIVSHELKTPLAVISVLLSSKKRRRGALNKESIEHINKIDYQINKLTKLISSLLDVTKIRRGRLELSRKAFSIDRLVREVAKDMERTVENRKIILKGRSGKYVKADRDRMEEVFVNIISNALKYSAEDKDVIITIKSLKNRVSISIQDFGIGISKENLERIFEPFYRIERHIRIPSTGLGLYISSEIVKAHNGEIKAYSSLGKGSTFVVILPAIS